MSAMVSYRARDVGPMPPPDLFSPVLPAAASPRASWRSAWRRARLCCQYSLPGDLGLWLRSECDLRAYVALNLRASEPRCAKRSAGLVSFINNVQRGG